ncbi:MAG: penicillin acylase family protein [Ferruginibacter sp.]
MKYLFLIFLIIPSQLIAQSFTTKEIKRWKEQASEVTIIRDNWGIPHVYGKTDADAVFGLMYAQCEDDFKRIEMNYIEKLGRLSEIKGMAKLYDDLLMRILIDSSAAIADYKTAAPWLKKLLIAFADGINFYLFTHPGDKPVLLDRFEPWYPLLWTDGSIGAIKTAGITATDLGNFYSGKEMGIIPPQNNIEDNSTGSNGFAIAPSLSASGNALLYINPHVTFYFRPEVHVVSNEGLNAYGAVTWGQFFVYQGFNEFCGWMHTSSDADVADLYEETISKKGNSYFYLYNGKEQQVKEHEISIQYKDGNVLNKKSFRIYSTGHGPVMGIRNGKWVSLASNNRDIKGLIQCWQRNKVKSFDEYKELMDMAANTSNNTVYADAGGNIAYWHGNFMPKRNTKYDWSQPVDGTIPATAWHGLHNIAETVHLYNPPNGWLQNCNATPFTVAGDNSPKRNNYPSYMAPDAENFRGINAVRVLQKEKKYTIDKLIAAGYDNYIAAFEKLVPALVNAYEKLPKDQELSLALAEPVEMIRNWDLRCSENSIATTLAIEWGYRLLPTINKIPLKTGEGLVEAIDKYVATAAPRELLDTLLAVIKKLQQDFAKWQISWGEINRFQRITDDIDAKYNDAEPSLPVAYVSATWGMLPSYSATRSSDTKKRYGVHGNSFVCVVEFGKKIKAKSLLAGGESGHRSSSHFNDQGLMYSKGQFKDVLFYKEDVMKHLERSYHPGE